jgi:hypothetical protein
MYLKNRKFNITQNESFTVEIDGYIYTRFGPESWMFEAGNSMETVSYPDDLEREFQARIQEEASFGEFCGEKLNKYSNKETLIKVIKYLAPKVLK